ncbi:phosphonate transport system substrate-binding protein [Alkalispirochaeta americana]|uniref:Phosphonate transport system substrate-binding protein n=1 Tax=Alkalispirochaeta americana TaxID=159291 RepID=A0A1N6N9L6_9SPIO|nr:phosphate/phosphite/phosphonate ABC transporter substrate-binding protein [Alkalispirochaeta americana]SIP88745.1 phosphonate transport system substrate-binding protein [Alkalispirochaeta americana]
MRRVLWMALAASVLLTAVAVAGGRSEEKSFVDDGRYDRSDWPEVVRIGVLPEEDQAVMMERYQPFLEHVEGVLGVKTELFFGNDFTAMVEAMRFEHIEVSKFGPSAYVMAAERAGAEAFVQGVRDASAPTYKSYIIARDDSGIDTIEDVLGRNFAWVDPASGSGYLFPRAMMLGALDTTDEKMDALFENVIFSGGHDASVRFVINGDVDAAAVSDSQIQRMRAAEFPGMENIVVVAETDPIPRSPEAYRSNLPDSLKQALFDAYTTFDDRDFLEAHNYHDGFVPVTDAAYDVVRDTQQRLGL